MTFSQQQFEAALKVVQSDLADWIEFGETPLLSSLYTFNTTASTNRTLWELLDQGAAPGTVAIAAQQVAGRGQWGREWQSPLGGLYLSIALAPDLPVENSAQLTLCSAWGIAIALRHYGIPVQLKWPNDLVLLGRKLGGILTETRIQQGQITKAVIGVGINWANPVPETGINLQDFLAGQGTSTVMPSTNPPIASLEMLAAIALTGLLGGYQYWQQEGMETLLPSYLELLTSVGCPVTVEGRSGVVVGVSTTGDLRVRFPTVSDSSSDSLIAPLAAPAAEIYCKPGTIRLGYG